MMYIQRGLLMAHLIMANMWWRCGSHMYLNFNGNDKPDILFSVPTKWATKSTFIVKGWKPETNNRLTVFCEQNILNGVFSVCYLTLDYYSSRSIVTENFPSKPSCADHKSYQNTWILYSYIIYRNSIFFTGAGRLHMADHHFNWFYDLFFEKLKEENEVYLSNQRNELSFLRVIQQFVRPRTWNSDYHRRLEVPNQF